MEVTKWLKPSDNRGGAAVATLPENELGASGGGERAGDALVIEEKLEKELPLPQHHAAAV